MAQLFWKLFNNEWGDLTEAEDYGRGSLQYMCVAAACDYVMQFPLEVTMVCLSLLHACGLSLSPRDYILPSINGVKTGPYLFGAGVCFSMQGGLAHALLPHPLRARTH